MAGNLIQGLFALLIGILRFGGLLLSQIPGTKHVLKHLPWHEDEDFIKKEKDLKLYTYKQLREDYYSQPEQVAEQERYKRPYGQIIIEKNRVFTRAPFKQASHITFTAKVNGTSVKAQ